MHLKIIRGFMAKESQYERKLSELAKIRDYITDIITQSLKLNAIDKLTDIPITENEPALRKQNMLKLYAFLESNFTNVFTSGLVFNCTATGVVLSKQEEDFYRKRKSLSDEYRALYNALHEYLNFVLNKLGTLYRIDGLWIWQLKTENIKEEKLYR